MRLINVFLLTVTLTNPAAMGHEDALSLATSHCWELFFAGDMAMDAAEYVEACVNRALLARFGHTAGPKTQVPSTPSVASTSTTTTTTTTTTTPRHSVLPSQKKIYYKNKKYPFLFILFYPFNDRNKLSNSCRGLNFTNIYP